MEAKEFLQRSFRLYLALDSKAEQIQRLQSLAQKITTVIKGAPSASAETGLEQSIAAIQEREKQLNADVENMLSARAEIELAIAAVPKYTERALLEYRYLSFLPWSIIAQKMKCSIERVYRIHRDALKNFPAVTVNDSSRTVNDSAATVKTYK